MAEAVAATDGCPGPLVNDPAPGAGAGEVQEMTATGCAGNTEVTLVSINGGGTPGRLAASRCRPTWWVRPVSLSTPRRPPPSSSPRGSADGGDPFVSGSNRTTTVLATVGSVDIGSRLSLQEAVDESAVGEMDALRFDPVTER